ncbi:TIGR03560 family F420-dependent LLM class oxidoreductase [Spongiactinospora sp. 9N601]|uniref:TIGR03560 family F420-dependent LLM class oxidoreductase n=1 Tax=Spongiactinospora sp. 9N601 TaxID=3375149 RepID=UPI00379177A6
MRVSINVTNYSWPGGPERIRQELIRLAGAADESGIDTLWVSDHLIQADPTAGPGETDMLEAYTVLGFAAARTERVNLGTMVTGVTFRPATLLVKAVTTLDVLSGGRAWLGVGTGYHQPEADAMGLPLPPLAERYERLDETLRIALRMWSGDESPFEGTHYRLTGPSTSPRPLAPSGRPKILIGGTGERKTLRLVARYADACNLFDVPDGGRTIRHKLDVLARHCDELGRPYHEIEKTLSTRLAPDESPAAFTHRCTEAAALGIDHITLITPGPWTPAHLTTIASALKTL